jgi:glycosyltransferase involved in cell wall biosynthesis
MKTQLSLNIITKNAGKTLKKTLSSVVGLVDEIILVDENSTDNTLDIACKYNTKIYKYTTGHLGKQREYALSKSTGEWVLVLDADETISDRLRSEIEFKIKNLKFKINENGYNIPFQTHFLGKPLHHGGEDYAKMVLFKRKYGKVLSLHIHEKYEIIQGRLGKLKNSINHYSYESIIGLYKKFTNYALRAAKQKRADHEKVTLNKIFLYPVHMFWSRFVTDKGYKDGLFRIPLDLAFAYMEFMTYFLMLFLK